MKVKKRSQKRKVCVVKLAAFASGTTTSFECWKNISADDYYLMASLVTSAEWIAIHNFFNSPAL